MTGMASYVTTMTDAGTGRRLRILAIHRYFWPDTPPYATMLRAIARRWADEGHDVQVLSTQPSYKPEVGIEKQPAMEMLDGFGVKRVNLPQERGRPLVRLINLLRFSAAILIHSIRSGRFDLIMCSTSPPVFAGLATQWAARLTGARFIYHCMDLHPEIGRISGEFSNRSVFGVLKRLDMRTCRAADRVVVLSEDMKESLIARGGEAPRVDVINNFELYTSDSEEASELPPDLRKEPEKFRVLFAGNIGRFQGLETVVSAMRELSDRSDVEMVFMGEGKAVETLKSLAGPLTNKQVKFFPHQPFSIAKRIMTTADVGLVSLAPDIYRYAYPSKTMTNLRAGLPLIVVVEPESELARFVRDKGIGVAVPVGDSPGLAAGIKTMADNLAKTRQMAQRAYDIGEVLFSEDAVLRRWSSIPEEVLRD